MSSMARYSPIGPLSILRGLQSANMLGDYLLMLAHDVNAHPLEYTNLISWCNKEGCSPFIIMDNGTVELGKPLPAEEVVEAATTVSANCIVLPDVIGDSTATKVRINRDLDLLKSCSFPLMCVPQGRNPSEVFATIEWMHKNVPYLRHNYWGIPRWFAQAREFGTRRSVIDYINHMIGDTNYKPEIHLLGMSSNLTDDIECCQMENVMGIDSANPLVMGQHYRGLRRGDVWIHMDRGNYWEDSIINPVMVDNIRYIRWQITGSA